MESRGWHIANANRPPHTSHPIPCTSATCPVSEMPTLTPTQAQWLTLAFVVAVTVLVIGYDVLAIHANGVEASISRVLRRLFGRHPTLFAAMVFWLGVLVGHIWLPTE